jgi:salicylate hydroxylase
MKVLIVGGGIGGLTAALALHKAGLEVCIFERMAQPDEAGAGIQISPNGSRVLHALGLSEALEAVVFRPEGVELRLQRSGFTVVRTELGDSIAARYGFPYYHVHRADLHHVLEDAVRRRCGDVIRFDHEVKAVTQTSNSVTLQFTNGRTETGDVLIGCDGIHSKVRESLFGAEQPDFTGNVAWRGVVPVSRLKGIDLRPVVTSWMAPRSHAVTYFLRRGELVNFVGVTERSDWFGESWTERGSKDEMRRDFENWHPSVQTIVDAIDAPYRWALFVRKPLPKWSEGRVTLLGDACHPMLPFMAQGGVMAIEDASVLATCLAGGRDDITAALKRYEAARLPRTTRVQAGAHARGRLFHIANPALRLLTFGAMSFGSRLLPRFVASRNDWLMSYDATSQTTATNMEKTVG